jgi:predicted nucleic acid-binding protein
MDKSAALVAARQWDRFRRGGGGRDRIVADFLIGGHAQQQCDRLLTRNRGFYRTCFKGLTILDPTPGTK